VRPAPGDTTHLGGDELLVELSVDDDVHDGHAEARAGPGHDVVRKEVRV